MSTIKHKNILIIFNPTAGARSIKKLNNIINCLKDLGVNVEMSETHFAGHAFKLAKQAKYKNYDLIVAAGGDGTTNEVINGIYPSKNPVAIIPLGTVNVLAFEIALKLNIRSIVDYLAHGETKPCWLGNSNGRFFLLMMSVGHDAKAVAYVNQSLKALIGKPAYIISYIKSLLVSKNTIYEVTIGKEKFRGSNVIISNGRLYGGNFICAPEATLDDNQLMISMAQRRGWFSAIKYAVQMFLGKYPKSGSIISIAAKKCYVACRDPQEPIQLDGDAIGELPAEVSISDDYIQLLRP